MLESKIVVYLLTTAGTNASMTFTINEIDGDGEDKLDSAAAVVNALKPMLDATVVKFSYGDIYTREVE